MQSIGVAKPDGRCFKERRFTSENDFAFEDCRPSFRRCKRAHKPIETNMGRYRAAGSASFYRQHIACRSAWSGQPGKSQRIEEMAHRSTSFADRLWLNRLQIERALPKGIAHPRTLRISAAIWSTWIRRKCVGVL